MVKKCQINEILPLLQLENTLCAVNNSNNDTEKSISEVKIHLPDEAFTPSFSAAPLPKFFCNLINLLTNRFVYLNRELNFCQKIICFSVYSICSPTTTIFVYIAFPGFMSINSNFIELPVDTLVDITN